jgi:small conductance mechanosensitive channel
VIQLGDSAVELTVRIWAHKDNYWNVYFYMNEHVKKEFDLAGVTIPFPQRDVHLHPPK